MTWPFSHDITMVRLLGSTESDSTGDSIDLIST